MKMNAIHLNHYKTGIQLIMVEKSHLNKTHNNQIKSDFLKAALRSAFKNPLIKERYVSKLPMKSRHLLNEKGGNDA